MFSSFSSWDPRIGFRPRNIRNPKRRHSDQLITRNDRFSSAGEGGLIGKMFRRNWIVASMLLLTILWPIVHFTTRVPNSIARNDFVEDTSSLNLGNENDVLQAVSQEASDALKEPVGFIYADNSSDSDKLSARSGKRSEKKTRKQGSPLSNKDKAGTTKRVITRAERVMLLESESKEQNKDMGSQQSTNATLLERMEGKDRRPSIGTPSKVRPQMTISDAQVRKIKDQLVRAKVYLEFEPAQMHPHFIRELKERIKNVQNAIVSATWDSELPHDSYEKLKSLEQALVKGKRYINGCVAIEKRFHATIQTSQQKLQAETKQTQFLTQLAAKAIPRGLHCLPLRLSAEYFSLNSSQQNQFPNQEKFEDPKLYHYAIFSDNVLAAAVVVNSTLFHAKSQATVRFHQTHIGGHLIVAVLWRPEIALNRGKHVFHIVTDRLNYAAMRMWFLANPSGEAAVQVQKVEEFRWLNSSYSPVLKQMESRAIIDYYFRTGGAKSDGNLKYHNPKYLSILNHLRFYLPDIFPKLYKVIFLDDDVVVQKDLTDLWDIDLRGSVNGAVETCGKSFHRFDRYLNFSNPLIATNFDPHACGWAYGMNVFDLVEWRKQNITEIYHAWQELNKDRMLWKLGTLPAGLITFYNHTLALDRSLHVLGLGYDKNVKEEDIEQAAVIHYNGIMKPWLEIGMAKFRTYWSKYLNYKQIYLRECNIIPF